jgi:hypothetical protein
VDWHRRQLALDGYHIPSSLSHLREAIKRSSTALLPYIVNGYARLQDAERLEAGYRHSLVAACRMHYAKCVVRCSDPTAEGWRVKRESGEGAKSALNSGTAPATVSESKAILKVTAPTGAGRRFASPKGVRESGDRPDFRRIPSRWANWAMCFFRRRHPGPSVPSPNGLAHSTYLISIPMPPGPSGPPSWRCLGFESCGG